MTGKTLKNSTSKTTIHVIDWVARCHVKNVSEKSSGEMCGANATEKSKILA
jgi:hypothetical protein